MSLQNRLGRGIGFLQFNAPILELLERNRHAGDRAPHEPARPQVGAQAAHRRGREHGADAERSQGGDVGPVGNPVRGQAVPRPMPGEKDRPPTAQQPVIVTDMELRRFVRKMVELEFSNLAVLSYQELTPELNIQPIGRISMRSVNNDFASFENEFAELPEGLMPASLEELSN